MLRLLFLLALALPAYADSMAIPPASSLRFSARQISQIITNTTTETAFAFDSLATIPAYTLSPGAVIHVMQCGVYQAGLTQNIQPRMRLGPAATALSSRTLLSSTAGPVSGLLNAAADTPWCADTVHIVQADSSIVSSGTLFFSTGATAALNVLVATATPVTGVDFTVDNILTASVQWGGAQTANQIRATTFFVEVLRP